MKPTATQLARIMRENNITPLDTIIVDTLLDNFAQEEVLRTNPLITEQFDALYDKAVRTYIHAVRTTFSYISPENITNALLHFVDDKALDFNQIISLPYNEIIAVADNFQQQEA